MGIIVAVAVHVGVGFLAANTLMRNDSVAQVQVGVSELSVNMIPDDAERPTEPQPMLSNPSPPELDIKSPVPEFNPSVPQIDLPDVVVFDVAEITFGEPWPEPPASKAPKPKRSPRQPSSTPSRPKVAKAAPKPSGAKVRRSVKPIYPSDALRAGVEGTTLIRLEVGVRGNVASARIARSSGHASLDRAAIKAARKWRFSPATRNGSPAASSVIVPIQFRLSA